MLVWHDCERRFADPLVDRVFLSTTSKDLAAYREAVHPATDALDGFEPIRMESFGARDDDAWKARIARGGGLRGRPPQRGTQNRLCYPGQAMKADIHPEYVEAHVTCSCGNEFTTRSTKAELHVEVCSACHPFYTGKQKLMDSGGRVERFQRRLEKAAAAQSS